MHTTTGSRQVYRTGLSGQRGEEVTARRVGRRGGSPRRHLSMLAGLVALSVGLTACGGGSTGDADNASNPSASGSKISGTITFQADDAAPQGKDYWAKVIDRFEAKYPDVKVKYISPPSAGERDHYAQTLLATGQFPDVSLDLNAQEFKDVLYPWDLKDPDLSQLQNKEQALIGGKLLGLGTAVSVWSGLFYNKDAFAKAGITEEPKTFDQLDQDLAKLKASGITPIVASGEWTPSFTFMATNDIFSNTPCWYGKRKANEVKFTDPEWVDAANRFLGWSNAGYFGKNALGRTYADAQAMFTEGKGAIWPMGDWAVGVFAETPPKFSVGWMPTPTRDGQLRVTGTSGASVFAVWKDSKNLEAAKAFAKFQAFDRPTVTEFLNGGGLAPNIVLKDGPLKVSTTPEPKPAILDTIAKAPGIAPPWNGQGDCGIVPGTDTVALKGLGEKLILGGKVNVPAELAKVDKFWASGGQ